HAPRPRRWLMPATNAGTRPCRSPHLPGSSHVRSESGRRAPSWRLNGVQWIGALRRWRRHSGSCASAASPRPVYFDDGRALGATQFLPLPRSSTSPSRENISFVVKWNEAFNHEDTSLGVVSASKAAEAEGSIPLWTTTLGRIRRNWPERLARDGVGSNRMRRRVQVRRRVVDWSTCLNARGGIRDPGPGVDNAECLKATARVRARQEVADVAGIEPNLVGARLVGDRSEDRASSLIDDDR